MLIIDQLAYASALRVKPAGAKMTVAVTIMLLTVIAQRVWVGAIAILLAAVITVRIGKTPVKWYLRLLRLPVAFILLSLIAIIIDIRTNIGVSTADWGVKLGRYYLFVSRAGCLTGSRLAVSAMGAVSWMYALSLSTPLTDILTVLKKIHCPVLLIELMMLIYRFIFILLETAGQLTIAQQSRCSNYKLSRSIYSTAHVLVMLLIRAMRRSSALYDAMESRGYDGTLHILNDLEKEQ